MDIMSQPFAVMKLQSLLDMGLSVNLVRNRADRRSYLICLNGTKIFRGDSLYQALALAEDYYATNSTSPARPDDSRQGASVVAHRHPDESG